MRVLVIGGGGREHALVHTLARSARVNGILCVPGNAGTASIAENIDEDVNDHGRLVSLARERGVDLTVVGPEAPLCAGIVDRFEAEGLRIFGPNQSAARIEGDKAYAKHLMKLAHVPTAEARVFERHDEARSYVASRDTGVVVKAAGLAAGKGVSVCEDPADALLALERIMVDRAFGDAGHTVVVEELLKGQELSVFALVDGRTIYVLDTAQDHKPIGEGDTGPNTGGMGAYSPAPMATPGVMATVEREILVPIVDAMRNDGASYRGLLYAGLMLTAAGPKVLEFNCRFGDPETQPILMRLQSDLYDLLETVIEGRLAEAEVCWSPKPAVCVVMASEGYPGKYESGKVIDGLDRVAEMKDVCVFHAGTRRLEHLTLSSGGRVLGVTALGDDIADAKRRAYEAVEAVHFENARYRRDIADKAIGYASRA
ncbi:MAG: phosphoribosylamine--glycine ligase [Phycisphaerae bacterium]